MRVRTTAISETDPASEEVERAPIRQGRAVARKEYPTPDEIASALDQDRPNLAQAIKKSNDLVRAHYALSLNASRLLAYLVSVLDTRSAQETGVCPLLRFPVSYLGEVYPALSKNGSLHERMRKACHELFEARVVVSVGAKQEPLALRWVTPCAVIEGHVLARLTPDVLPYLVDLKERYTTQSLMYLVELRTAYQYRLYEIFRSYAYRYGCYLSFEELKQMLVIDQDQYQLVGHFVSRVLKPALKDINAVTDIQVDIERNERRGRKIVGWHFKIVQRKQRKLPLSPAGAPLIEEMVSLGVGLRAANELASFYAPEIVKANIEFVRDKLAAGYDVRDVTSFLKAALEDNYASEMLEAKEAAERAERRRAEQDLHRAAERSIEERKRTAVPRFRMAIQVEAAKARFDRLSDDDQKDLISRFSDTLLHAPNGAKIAAQFAKDGLQSPMAASHFRVFLVDHFQIPEPSELEVKQRVAMELAKELSPAS